MYRTLSFFLFCITLTSGCAHRSGFIVESTPGYKITYPEITWDYPGHRARVVYKSYQEVKEMYEKSARDRHRDKAIPAPLGGSLVVFVIADDAHNISAMESIILRSGKVEQRVKFSLDDARVEVGQSSAFLKVSAWIDLDIAPQPGEPVQLDIVGPGLRDGPYSFKISKL